MDGRLTEDWLELIVATHVRLFCGVQHGWEWERYGRAHIIRLRGHLLVL
jgi:hypothetical protein